MESFSAALLSALWLGILTSISPCPLTTNIVAVSYIGKQLSDIKQVMLAGIVYSLGRVFAYLAVGMIVVAGVLSIPSVSMFLQRYMAMLLGPVLIIAGLFLLEMIAAGYSGPNYTAITQKFAGKGSVSGAGFLGMLFALSFCPVSAALFFGSLIPLSIRHESAVLLPSLYGVGTGLPVLLFALLVAFGAGSLGAVFNRITVFERWARRITGGIFILAGVYMSLRYIFQIF